MYMEKTGPTKNHPALCKLCEAQGKRFEVKRYDGSTKLMIQHLREYHSLTEKGKEDKSTGTKG